MAIHSTPWASKITGKSRKTRSMHISFPNSDPRHNNSIRVQSNTFKMATGPGHPYNPDIRLNIRRAFRLGGSNSRTSTEYEVKKGSHKLTGGSRSVHFAGRMKRPSSGHSGG